MSAAAHDHKGVTNSAVAYPLNETEGAYLLPHTDTHTPLVSRSKGTSSFFVSAGKSLVALHSNKYFLRQGRWRPRQRQRPVRLPFLFFSNDCKPTRAHFNLSCE